MPAQLQVILALEPFRAYDLSLLMETGDVLLLESGDSILLDEGAIPLGGILLETDDVLLLETGDYLLLDEGDVFLYSLLDVDGGELLDVNGQALTTQ